MWQSVALCGTLWQSVALCGPTSGWQKGVLFSSHCTVSNSAKYDGSIHFSIFPKILDFANMKLNIRVSENGNTKSNQKKLRHVWAPALE